jgi:hypothetical protein
MDEFFFEFLSQNLIHAMQSAKILYHLSKVPVFSKEILGTELDRLENNVNYGNAQINKMVGHDSKAKKVNISKYIKNVDEHLALVFVDIKTIRKDLKRKKNISPLLSDIYYQFKNAKYNDHNEIKKILKYQIYKEPQL